MPRTFSAYEPDWIDVNAQLTALGEDFGVRCEFTITTERDHLVVIARAYRIGGARGDVPDVQALARRPLKSRPDAAIMCFSTAQDCWRQLDRGTFAAASRPVAHEWNGRPHVARRSK